MRGAWHRILVDLGLGETDDPTPPVRWRIWLNIVLGAALVVGVPVDLVVASAWQEGALHLAWLAVMFLVGCGALVTGAGYLRDRGDAAR